MGSRIVEVKRALVSALDDLSDLDDVAVEYGYNAAISQRRRIFTRRAVAQIEPASLKAGKVFRNERMTFELVVLVEAVGGSAEDAEDEAVNDLGLVVEDYIANNSTLGGAVTGLNWIVVSGLEVTPMFNDRGHLAEAAYELTYDARLT